jgi:ABC-2 type transport system permease protein
MKKHLTPLLALWLKEWLALMRDRHALAALFLMPAAFILIMSLALQDSLSPGKPLELGYVVVDLDRSDSSRELTRTLREQTTLRDHGTRDAESQALEEIRQGRHAYALLIPKGFADSFASQKNDAKLRLSSDPTIPQAVELAFRNQILAALGMLRVNEVLRSLPELTGQKAQELRPGNWQQQLDTVAVRSSQDDASQAHPSAVQQSVPAWLIFSMFFVVIPIAAIFVTERQHGTLQRLRAMQVPYALILAGKLLPFFIINQIQALLMLLVGRWLVPLLGGDALVLPPGFMALGQLWCMAAATSLAAVSLALLIASLARTSEQATILGGVGNILMGAIGGIMAPKFIMPLAMQKLTLISPMAWALDGFHAVLLRGSGFAGIAPYAFALLAFAAATLALAVFVNHLNQRRHS